MYSKFKIGDIVRCIHYHERLTIGKDYEVIDVDYLFPVFVTVKLKGYKFLHSGFISEEFFMDPLAKKREDKIDKIFSK